MTRQQYEEHIWNHLVCPNCRHRLRPNGEEGTRCAQCGSLYTHSASGALDLRLQTPKTVELQFELGTQLDWTKQTFVPLRPHPAPEVDFSEPGVPFHLSPELMTYIPRAQHEGSLMLDLGCGGSIHRQICEHAGFVYVGVDYDSPKAPLLGDAHALPFDDETFEFVLSIAVLEHIRFPSVVLREVYRTLKPGGKFIGTVAFLEPFHLNSYYHHTHLGILSGLQDAGLLVEQIAPNSSWTGLRAQAMMTLFPRMPVRLASALISPLQHLHRLWWHARSLKNRSINPNDAIRDATGSFTFIATKPLLEHATS
jgi:SAM-dependent methyltransferase